MVTIDLKGFYVPLAVISVGQLRATGVSFAICEFLVEFVYENSVILYTKNMTQLSEPALSKHNEHRC